MGYIYKITNTLNGKIYIGRTTAEKATRRWNEHKSKAKKDPRTPIEFAINKYGSINFTFEVIKKEKNLSKLPALETKNILKHNSLSPNGYNLELYQPFRILNKESLLKISLSNQGKIKGRNKSSKYIGVYKSKNSFYSEIRHRNIKYKKAFGSELKCAIAYDKMALFLYGEKAKINFNCKKDKWLKANLKKFFHSFNRRTPIEEAGLFFDKKRKKWQSRLRYENKTIHLGRFRTKGEAVAAKIKKMRELGIYV